MKYISLLIIITSMILMPGCIERPKTSDSIQSERQEKIVMEGIAQTGIPAIKNFQELKLAKFILELRDQEGLVTYTYLKNEMTGRLVFLGETIGYGLPYAAQMTNPEKVDRWRNTGDSGIFTLPQSEPNGLFSPESANATWVLMKDPNGDKVLPIYVESDLTVSPFKLPESIADYK